MKNNEIKLKQQEILQRKVSTPQLRICTEDDAKEGNKYKVSLYTDELIADKDVLNASKMLFAAFPELNNDFIHALIDVADESGFTGLRLIDSVKHVIATCEYPRPAIARFLKHDKSVNVYTYNEAIEQCRGLISETRPISNYFTAVRLHGPDQDKPFYVKVSDFDENIFEKWSK